MKRYYLRNKRAIGVFLITNIFAAVSSVFLSFLLGTFADAAMEGSFDRVWKIGIGTLVYLCVETYFSYSMQFTRDAAIHKIGRSLRADVIRKLEKLPYWEKQKRDDGYYISLINNDVGTVEQEYLDSLGAIYFQICCFAIAVVAAIVIQPVMTAIMLVVSVLPVFVPKLTEKRLQSSKEEEQGAKASYLGAVTQIFSGFFLLKAFNSFAGINRLHDKENEQLCDAKVKFSKLSSALYAGAYGSGNLIYLGTWVVGLFFVAGDFITLPQLVTFSQLMTFVAGPIQIISERFSMTVAASAVCKRLIGFLDAPTDEDMRWGTDSLGVIDDIELSGLCYAADNKPILRDVDLHLHKGDRVALLGESGSGKSTLMKLLASMYDWQGTYKINGRPCRSYEYSEFRDSVVLLEQKSFIFNATLRDNLTLFAKQGAFDSAEIERILGDVGLSEWFKSRGGSLDTQIGSESRALSGGEERRLDLGRVLCSKARLVMLDEPTTGLDKESRQLVEETIADLSCDILIVAMHEYSPEFLKSFNRIVRVKAGTVDEA